MYAQNRYQQEEIDRVQAEAEKMYLNKNGEYNGRDDHGREERGREERGNRYSDEYDDRRRYSDEYDDRRRSSGEHNDRHGYNDRYGGHDERDREYNNDRYDSDREVRRTHVTPSVPAPAPAPVTPYVPVTYTHVPVPTTHVSTPYVPATHVPVPVSTNIKKYRAATYDKHDRVFAKQMLNFIVPEEFTTFTSGLLKEHEVNRLCLLEAIADYNKTGGKALPEDFQKAAEHCRKYRSVKYDIHDRTYAKQMQFYELPPEFSEFTDGLLKETHINRFDLLEAIENYKAKGLPRLPGVFEEVAFNCRPYQSCIIC